MKRKVSGIVCLIAAFFGMVFMQAEEARASFLSFSKPAPATNLDSFPGIIAQHNVGACACGPCAIFNAFQLGSAPFNHLAAALPGDAPADKVRALIQRYGNQPSLVTPAEPRYLAQGGMWDADVVPFINDWLKDNAAAPVTGERLTRRSNENPQQYLQRVYGELNHSLAAGFPPVVNLQSFSARQGFFHHQWKWMDGHFVTVVAVQENLSPNASQFCMWVVDSESGRILPVFVNAGPNQAETVLASNRIKRSGKSMVHPVQTYPYLMIQSPKLERVLAGDAAKSDGAICVLQYIAHR